MMNRYKPEGTFISTAENREYISSLQGLERAAASGRILEATALLCDNRMRLHVDLYGIRGIIDSAEAAYNPTGEAVKDIAIITRVGKPVCFKVLGTDYDSRGQYVRLSRREAQLECYRNYIADLTPGDIIDARVTHLEAFGAFVDIGCGISSLLSVDCISVSRIAHPRDRLWPGMQIRCAVKTADEGNGRVFVTMRELLGTWQENAAGFEAGQTVAGIVRGIEDYGIFVELTPNLAGLAELRDDGARPPRPGMCTAVYIKSIIPERMKIKLVLVDSHSDEPVIKPPKYFIDSRTPHIDRWRYSPECSGKVIETVFTF